ncbi:hypothetical protein GH714_034984 [Hevea brasiliensis]|uniref:Uncharacterized protein n=1 Tax=Hevea brasiliensis TaxID=3981 RepID=A0A6A6NCV1_HEVBR|nr:hypothetical protein GH714_034984 [Hevea brasiliensis]
MRQTVAVGVIKSVKKKDPSGANVTKDFIVVQIYTYEELANKGSGNRGNGNGTVPVQVNISGGNGINRQVNGCDGDGGGGGAMDDGRATWLDFMAVLVKWATT